MHSQSVVFGMNFFITLGGEKNHHLFKTFLKCYYFKIDTFTIVFLEILAQFQTLFNYLIYHRQFFKLGWIIRRSVGHEPEAI